MGMTDCGRDWLTAALDPFHDNQLNNLRGYPDAVTAPSVIRCVKKSLVISKPGALAAGPWNAHVVVWPWMVGQDFFSFTNAGGNVITLPGGTTTGALPQVCVYTSSGIIDFDYTAPESFGTSLDPAFITGMGRLVSMGIETVNTTAEINKQGSLVVWRQTGLPGPPETYQYLTGAVVTRVASLSKCQTPPLNESGALIIPGSRQWKAADGAYCVVPFQSIQNDPVQLNNIVPYFTATGANSGALGAIIYQAPQGTSSTTRQRLAPVNQCGTMFNGLSDQSTIVLNVVWYYEYFPSFFDEAMVPLARPSCEYDPIALKAYVEVLNSLPVGVPFSWNEEGSWWQDVVSAIRKHASTVGTMLGGPVGAIAGKAIGEVAGWAQDTYMTAPGQNMKAPKKLQQSKARKPQKVVEVVKVIKAPNNQGKKQLTKAQKQREVARLIKQAGIS